MYDTGLQRYISDKIRVYGTDSIPSDNLNFTFILHFADVLLYDIQAEGPGSGRGKKIERKKFEK